MIIKFIVRLRMWYADIRGHHGKRWDYEPGEWYMGRHKKRKDKKNEPNVRQERRRTRIIC